MATSVAAPGTPVAEGPSLPQKIVAWTKAHREASFYGLVGIAIAAGLFGWSWLSKNRVEQDAAQQLLEARSAFEAKNWALAASELARITENYSGTRAADEGTLLLAQVRLLQGQGQQAIAVLKDFAPGADKDYRAQAYGLLGAAYENIARPAEAAVAYHAASDAAQFDFLKAQFLSDAGRAHVAALDTAQAVQAYRRILKDFDKSAQVQEAKVRLGELTKGAGIP